MRAICMGMENIHRTVSVVLDGLDFDLSSAHRGDAPSLREVRGFYELIQLLGRCGETVMESIRRLVWIQAEGVSGWWINAAGARSHT